MAVMTISVIMYKRLGISNTELAFYTGWLNLPWVIKPLWSPFIDLIKTKRWWIITMQLLIGAGLAGIAFTIPTEHFSNSLWPFSGYWHSAPPHTTLLPTALHAGTGLASASPVCRNPQYLLPYCNHCGTRITYHACRKTGNNDR